MDPSASASPAPGDPPATAGVDAPAPFPLHYAKPKPPEPDPFEPVIRVVRRIVFALGLGLLAFGLTCAIGGVYTRDAPYFAGWGAGFVGLAVPLRRAKKAP